MPGARREAEQATHWWVRRTAAKEVAAWAERQADARQSWQDHVAPEAARLDAAIGLRPNELARLNASVERQAAQSAMLTHRRRVTQGIVAGLGARVGQYRDRLDGPGRQPVGRAVLPVYPPFGTPTVHSAPAPGHDQGPDL
jgi:hypothetical protein